jgi:hypothetical protein
MKMTDGDRSYTGFRRSLAQSIFGWDIFISHRTKSRSYALALRDQLQDKGFVVFVDDSDLHAGTPVESYIREARKSRMFILVGTDDILGSQHVPREISAYCKRRGWFRLVPISVDGALAEFESPEYPVNYAETPWKALFGIVSESESESAIAKGLPSASVLARIIGSYDVVRGKVRLRRLTLIVGLVLAAAVIVTGSQLKTQQKRLGAAQYLLASTEQRRSELDNQIQNKQAELLLKENELSRTQEQVGHLNGEVIKKQLVIGSLQKRIDASTIEVTKTRAENTRLSNDNKDLEQRNEVARARLTATDMLKSDPVIAYRLAEKIFSGLAPNDGESESLLFESASRATFPYQERFQNCEVAQVNPPWALLGCKEADNQVWKILSVQTGTLKHEYRIGSQKGQRAWIVPHGSSWHLVLYSNIKPETQDKRAEFNIDILDDSGAPVSSVPEGIFPPQMCGSDRLIVQRYKIGYVTILDANTGELTPLASHLAPGEALTGCKKDGTVSVARSGRDFTTLELFDRKGELSTFKAVGNEVDTSPESAESTWSPDGSLLAIWRFIPGGGRLSILDPMAKTTTDVTPKDWVETAFAWRNDHQLVIAGHHRDDTDFDVGLLDGMAPNASRVSLHCVNAQVQDIASLSDQTLAIADVDGLMRITSTSGKETRSEGRHAGLQRLYPTGRFLLSSSSDDVRLWRVSPPTTNWIFRSTNDRRYLPCAAGDPTFHWQAAGFRARKGIGIEVRSVDGSKDPVTVALPERITNCSALAFSKDGRWLAAFGKGGGVVFDTRGWISHEVRDDSGEPIDLLSPVGVSIYTGGLHIEELAEMLGRQSRDFRIDLTGDVPKVSTTSKAPEGDMIGYCFPGCPKVHEDGKDHYLHEDFVEQIKSWRTRLPDYPIDRKLIGCSHSGWVERILVYNEPRADIEFIPVDAKRLTHLFDSMVFRIPDEEISAIFKRKSTKNVIK